MINVQQKEKTRVVDPRQTFTWSWEQDEAGCRFGWMSNFTNEHVNRISIFLEAAWEIKCGNFVICSSSDTILLETQFLVYLANTEVSYPVISYCKQKQWEIGWSKHVFHVIVLGSQICLYRQGAKNEPHVGIFSQQESSRNPDCQYKNTSIYVNRLVTLSNIICWFLFLLLVLPWFSEAGNYYQVLLFSS